MSRLTDKDTIVIADFANRTGDVVFDDALKTALSVALNQSRFLNVLSENKVADTLQQMTRPPGTRLTPELARELCQRTGSKAYIAGSIGSMGSEYVLGLKAVNCQNGDTLAQEQVTAPAKEKVLDVLGRAVGKLRGELGESLATVQRFDVPLGQATTPSLEALRQYSLGQKADREKGPGAALPYHQRAIQLDPNFAMGYGAVGWEYFSLAQPGRASEYLAKAFQLRDHATEREKLVLAATYYLNVTGELGKAAQAYEEQIESYPKQSASRLNLGVVYAEQGQHEKSAELTRQELLINSDNVAPYDNLADAYLALQRFDDARKTIREAQAKKLDDYSTRNAIYALAFLASDAAGMAEQEKWFAGKPEENYGLALASDTEAYAGHVSKARELAKRAVDSAIRADSKENGAVYDIHIRGEAYLAAGQSTAAGAEFQKIIDHSGLVWNCWTGALAHLGVARANAQQAKAPQGAESDAARVRALAAYKDFFTLWKDADPDIPILKQAKAEYAKLQ
jgi:Tfp pilus assembly protein PilF